MCVECECVCDDDDDDAELETEIENDKHSCKSLLSGFMQYI